MSTTRSYFVADIRPPRLRHSVGELGRVALEAGASLLCKRLFRTLPEGDGHTIMTIPGFMGADGSTALLRRFLRQRGYHAVPWGLGRNASDARAQNMQQFMRHRAALEEQIAERVEREYLSSGRKVTLIGWSLGGLYSVALAHRYPQWIRQVITLGTPFGDPRGTALYSVMARMNESAGNESEESLRHWVDYTYSGGELQVPILTLFSESDGIVGKGIARCEGDPAYVTNMAVLASHVGFPFNPIVFAVIGNHLVAPERRWAVCASERISALARVVN
ncbi:esterase/lipase family protein [Pseudohalioglobus lutimaris]|uniref:Alpha/beta hydrolase n=1 Tax=Pseudohalioglobus lutimaris TaxID=1737061 RepID=A0A2N5X235_9GAMM|nr:alpha/beta hydrolase [Pseudohalioglobus lutimaris]PLW68520.1 alpha/beta hydrolase [Pseudohalioglobus lutimaris]